MATRNEEVNAAWQQVDEATTSLGARVQQLIDDINRTANEGLNGPQTENVLARLQALTGTLNAMGSNPTQPLPTEPQQPDQPMPGPFADGSGTANISSARSSSQEIDPRTGQPRNASGAQEIDPQTGRPKVR